MAGFPAVLPAPLRAFLGLATAAVLIAVLWHGQVVLVPVALAVMLSFVLTPPVRLLERVRLPRLSSGWTIEQLTTATLASELLLAITRTEPDVLCISSVPPGGLAHARYLCKRIHKQFPGLPIWILRPEMGGSADKTATQLGGDGAQQVATSFAAAALQLTRFVFAPSNAPLGENDRTMAATPAITPSPLDASTLEERPATKAQRL